MPCLKRDRATRSLKEKVRLRQGFGVTAFARFTLEKWLAKP